MTLRRIDQLLSALGYCTRKEAASLCRDGRVLVDGAEEKDGSRRVDPLRVLLDGEPLEHPQGLLLSVHKPVGFVCSHEPRDGRLVYELVPPRWRRRSPPLTSVGRLDQDTSGLLLLTDLGPLVHRLTSPKHHVEKTYLATLDRAIEPAHVDAFHRGLALAGEPEVTLPAVLRATGPRTAEVTLTEGRYHQVRRMFAACGLHVEALHRTRFGRWTLEGLEPGQWRVEGLDGAG